MKLLKASVAIAALLAPLALGVADASAQERRHMGPAEGRAQAQASQAPRGFNGGGERRRMGPGGGFDRQGGQVAQADRGFRGGGDGGRFGGQGPGQGFRGQGDQRQRFQGQRFQGQAPGAAAQAPVQRNDQGRADRRGFDGQRNFRGGDNDRFDGRRFDGQRNFDRGGRDWNNRNDGRGYDRGRNWNDNRFYDNRRGERFSYRGRDFFRFRTTPYVWPRGYAYRSWAPRQILPPLFLADQYYMDDFWTYGLEEPPYGYRWVRVGQDALLVDVYSGEILDVVPGVFYW